MNLWSTRYLIYRSLSCTLNEFRITLNKSFIRFLYTTHRHGHFRGTIMPRRKFIIFQTFKNYFFSRKKKKSYQTTQEEERERKKFLFEWNFYFIPIAFYLVAIYFHYLAFTNTLWAIFQMLSIRIYRSKFVTVKIGHFCNVFTRSHVNPQFYCMCVCTDHWKISSD